jgi:hypothetical protein
MRKLEQSAMQHVGCLNRKYARGLLANVVSRNSTN